MYSIVVSYDILYTFQTYVYILNFIFDNLKSIGVPQGFILVLCLFIVYLNDFKTTTPCSFGLTCGRHCQFHLLWGLYHMSTVVTPVPQRILHNMEVETSQKPKAIMLLGSALCQKENQLCPLEQDRLLPRNRSLRETQSGLKTSQIFCFINIKRWAN